MTTHSLDIILPMYSAITMLISHFHFLDHFTVTLTDSLINNQTVCGSGCNPVHLTILVKADLFEQIKLFFVNLFDTNDWPARWHCGTWSKFHGWLYISSDLAICLSYLAIPSLLFFLLRKRKDVPFSGIIILFGTFIGLCGLTHLVDVALFWWPAYRLSGILRLLTGLISLITVYALYKIIPKVHSFRTIDDLEKEIKEKKLVADSLAESEFLLLETGRIAKAGGWEFKLDNREVFWSNSAYDIIEVPYKTKITFKQASLYILPGFKYITKQAIKECISSGKSYDLQLQIITATGKTIWIRTYGEAYRDKAGKIIKLRGVIMDIDQYKNNETLLKRSIELLSQHNTQLKNFNHILSHDIRNHASNFTLISSLINENTLDEENLQMFIYLKKVSEALNATLQVLSDALKIKENVLNSEVISFEEITNQVVKIMGTKIDTFQVSINCNYQIKTVLFPRAYLESILINLLSNAIKYRKKDVSPDILLSTYIGPEGFVILECTDNGIGIDLKLHGNKIFGLYKTFHDRKDAHGVGLFMIKTQIESQGGEILVESTPDIGSTFKVKFNEKN